MKKRVVALASVGMLLAASIVFAQTHPLRGPEPSGGVVEPDQPVRPQIPTFERRAAEPRAVAQPPAPPQPPFTLTPEEQAQVDRVLAQWEQRNNSIKTFDCRFKRWIYNVVWSGTDKEPTYVDLGVIKYAAPDRGLFHAQLTMKDGKETPIELARAEHWISDGKSIFELNPTKKQLIEHKLPQELQGKAIADSPLPFLFGAGAQKLKQRYWMRIVTPNDVKDQIWLEAFPRYQQDAANFHHAHFIIAAQGMSPFALKLIQPNEKDFTVYQFYDIVINDPLRLFQGDPFRPYTPLGWQKVVENPPAAQAQRPGGAQQ